MPQKNIEEVEQLLLDLYEADQPFLTEYPWEWEDDRWEELITCLLSEGLEIPPDLARRAVQTLGALRVASAPELARADLAQKQFIQRVLVQVGIDNESAASATSLLVSVAGTVMGRWEGYIQRFLRDHGQRMVQELRDIFIGDILDTRKATKVATLWLQNVANLPVVLTDNTHIQTFCAQAGISEERLVEIADGLGLNVAVLDDLLAFEGQRSSKMRGVDSTSG